MEDEEGGANHVPTCKVPPHVPPRLPREEVTSQLFQESLSNMSNERGTNKEQYLFPRQGRKCRRSQRHVLRRQQSSSNKSMSSSHKVDRTPMEGSIRNGGMYLLCHIIHHLWMIPHQAQVTNLPLHLPWKKDARRRRRAMTVRRGRPSPHEKETQEETTKVPRRK